MIYTSEEIMDYFYIKYEEIFLKFIEELKDDMSGNNIFNKPDKNTNADFVELMVQSVDIKKDFLKHLKK